MTRGRKKSESERYAEKRQEAKERRELASLMISDLAYKARVRLDQRIAALYVLQDGRCAICKDPCTFEEIEVDHDHATDLVRGLLCGACNRGLGHFHDDTSRLHAAVGYLRRRGSMTADGCQRTDSAENAV